MKLLRMTATGKDGSRVMLWFDDDTRMQVTTSVVAKSGLYAGMELDDEALSSLMDASQRASARSRAVRIVSSTAISEKSLRQRLVQRGERPADADAAVQWLHELGALDDEAMARRITESCIRKGYGKNRIRQELTIKGIPAEFRNAALENLPDLSASVDRFLERRLCGTVPDRKSLKKVTDALARRGFSWSEISAGVRRYRETLDDSDSADFSTFEDSGFDSCEDTFDL